MNVRHFLLLFLLILVSNTTTFAQSDKNWWKMSDDKSRRTPAAERDVSTGPTRGQVALEAAANAPPGNVKLVRADTFIIRDSTVFIDEMNGFEHYLMSAMRKKSVGLIVVADPMQADYIIFGNADTKRAGWAKMFFFGDGRSGEMASISMVNRRTKVVVFADSSHRYSALRGKRSTAEKLAKYLGKKIKQDENRMKH